jgi:hypothetical protein
LAATIAPAVLPPDLPFETAAPLGTGDGETLLRVRESLLKIYNQPIMKATKK